MRGTKVCIALMIGVIVLSLSVTPVLSDEELEIDAPSSVSPGEDFDVKVTWRGRLVPDAKVKMIDPEDHYPMDILEEEITNSQGKATFIAPPARMRVKIIATVSGWSGETVIRIR